MKGKILIFISDYEFNIFLMHNSSQSNSTRKYSILAVCQICFNASKIKLILDFRKKQLPFISTQSYIYFVSVI